MFFKDFLDFDKNLFDELESTTQFENVSEGRKGCTLADIDFINNIVPLVRTTTIYENQTGSFKSIHYKIIEKIKEKIKDKIGKNNSQFNNALLEIYDNQYRNMKLHSDQSLDLCEDSYICLFTCYNNPGTKNIRKLKIKNKNTSETNEFTLDHNSIIYWSYETNYKYLHQIVLKNPINNVDNNNGDKWFGITFRCSKTFIKFINNIGYFVDDQNKLSLATEEEKSEFYKLRNLENKNILFVYPKINYTVSPSDLIPPLLSS